MQIPVSAAKAQLTDLVRRAELGEEIVLTRRGRAAVRLVPDRPPHDAEDMKRALLEIGQRGRAKLLPGPCAARAADFLYDDDGLWS